MMFPCVPVEGFSYGKLPVLPSSGIGGHDLLRTEFHDLLKSYGNNLWLPVQAIKLGAEPGGEILIDTVRSAVEIESPNPKVYNLGRRILIAPVRQSAIAHTQKTFYSGPSAELGVYIIVDWIIEMDGQLIHKAALRES